jgi:uncharacterized protein YmfQ (DUF2313 family)
MNKQRLIELLSMPLTDIKADTNLQKELTEYYKFIYGVKACTSCKNKFDSYYQKLMVDGIERMTETPNLACHSTCLTLITVRNSD